MIRRPPRSPPFPSTPLSRSMVVEPPPAIEVGLDGGELDIATVGDQLGLERSVETLVLALCLRVIGPAMDRTDAEPHQPRDRKSTRLNSSHGYISYAVFCLKK